MTFELTDTELRNLAHQYRTHNISEQAKRVALLGNSDTQTVEQIARLRRILDRWEDLYAEIERRNATK